MTTTSRVLTHEGRSALLDGARASFARQGLYRSPDDRVVAGVCAALGRRVELRPWTARLLFVLVLMLLPGSQLIVYPVLWLLLPLESSRPTAAHTTERGRDARDRGAPRS